MDISKLEIQIIKNSPPLFAAEIFFPSSCGFFDGHFPTLALLPGVVQTHLAITLFEKYTKQRLHFTGAKNIKFFTPIFPESRVVLECEFDQAKGLLNFRYHWQDKLFAKGTLSVKNA